METTATYTGKKFFEHSKYWSQQLGAIDNAFKLKGNKFSNEGQSEFSEYFFTLDTTHQQTINKYSGGRGLERFILLKAGFDILFSKYQNSANIIIDTPLYLNSLKAEIVQPQVSLIQMVNREDSIKQFFQKVNERTLEGYEFQNFPFSLLTKDKTLADKFPLTNVLLFDPELHSEFPNNYPKHYDLIIEIVSEEQLGIKLKFNDEIFDQWFIENLSAHYGNVISCFQNLDTTIEEVAILSNQQKDKILTSFNKSQADFPKDKLLVEVFGEKVAEAPDNNAVIFKETVLTYEQLHQKSNQLAHYLREENKVKPGDCVGVLLEKSEHTIISFLAILKAGGVYVPIDPMNPKERIQHVINDTGLKNILTQSDFLFELEYFEGNLFTLDIQLDGLSNPVNNLDPVNEVTDAAYIIYTSGSTGKPKGVVVEHQGVVNLAFDHIRELNITSEDNVLQFFSLSFDASILDMVKTLLGGATLVLADKETVNDTEKFTDYLSSNKITLMTLTPSYLHTLNRAELPTLRIIITGGEAAYVDDALFYAQTKTFYNAYGPSEGTVNTTLYKIDKDSTYNSIPIGSPQSNKQVFILDNDLNVVPEGIIGEICISGAGLAREYLNDEALTARKFVENPYLPGARMYRTGDLGRWLPDGNIEFAGRKDDQIKIRGFRVELGEIENTLQKHSRIKEGVVLLKEGENSKNNELVAFVTERKTLEIVPSSGEYFIYDPFIYESMATDDMRVSGYQKAVENLVKDKVVIDPGTGTEMILARHCVAAGAKKVYAIEIFDEAYNKAKENLKKYGLEDKIELIHEDISEVVLPEEVDVCISALAGNITSSDGCITIINNLKSHLKQEKQVTFVPNKYYTKIGLVSFPEEVLDYALSRISIHYVEEIHKKLGYKFDIRLCLRYFTRDYLISDDGLFEYVEYAQDMDVDETNFVELNVTRDGVAHGFALWINAMFDDHMVINSIEETHHLPVYFPAFPEGVEVKKGDKVQFNAHRSLSDDELTTDYVLEGKIIRTGGAEEPFTFEALNHDKKFRDNGFYQKLFDENGDVKLINEFSDKGIKEYLGEYLPAYMVPHQIVKVDELPLTVNGKIDKKTLLEKVSSTDSSREEYVAPRTPEEKALVIIWQDALNKENIGIKDDFFSLGGDSIKSIQIVAKVKKQLDKDLDIGALYDNKTIEELAAYLIHQEKSEYQEGLIHENSETKSAVSNQRGLTALNQVVQTNRNMVLVPPVMGLAIFFNDFAKHIGDAFNCFGISFDLKDHSKSIEQVSLQYTQMINNESFDKQEKLYILGYSMGATIAYEIVKNLEQQGYLCELILVDRYPNEETFMNPQGSSGIESFKGFIKMFYKDISVNEVEDLDELFSIRARTLSTHRTQGFITADITAIEANASLESKYMKYWAKYTKGECRVHTINAAHHEIFKEEHFEHIYRSILKKEVIGLE